jgi:hypothetical protein
MNNTEVANEVKYFQWTKGEYIGDIESWSGEMINDDNMSFFVFESGREANAELLNDVFVKIASPNEPMIEASMMMSNVVRKPKLETALKTIPPPAAKKESNPIFALLEKSIKANTAENLILNIQLPPKDLIKVISSSFDDGEETVLNYLISQISIEEIQNQIKEQLRLSLFNTNNKENNEQD